MTTSVDTAFCGQPIKRNQRVYRHVIRTVQVLGIYAAGMVGTFAWGFSQAAGTACGNGVGSCLMLAGAVTGEAATWPFYWGPKLLGVA